MQNDKAILIDSATNTISNVTNLNFNNIILQGYRSNVASITSNHTLDDNDDVIIVSNTTGCTITLPLAGASGKIYNIKNINIGDVVIDANAFAGTIDAEVNQTLGQWDNIVLVDSANNQWSIL